MISPAQKQTVLNFFKQHPVTVVATADLSGTPGAAVVLFAETGDLDVIFGTHPTRKYRNLKANPKAALAMTKDYVGVQLHGEAHELTATDAAEAAKLFKLKHPEADQHLLADTVYFRFHPTWLRYMDLSQRPRVEWEVALG